MPPNEEVSTDDAALVFRRAAEIDQVRLKGSSLDISALEQAGLEAGLSRDAIRQALAEVRAGVSNEASGVASRTIDMQSDKIDYWLRQYMHGQGFRPIRDRSERIVWARDTSLAASLRRSLDFGRKMVLREVGLINTVIVPLPGEGGRCHVRFELDMSRKKRGLYALPISAGAIGVAFVAAAAALGTVPEAIVAAPGAIALTGGAMAGSRAIYRGSLRRSLTGVEHFLDRLEQRR